MAVNLSQPKTIVFHPGMGKTATSSIQEVGLSLPIDRDDVACFSPYGVLGNAHNALASNHPKFNAEVFSREWRKNLEFSKRRKASTIISSEFLIRDRAGHIKKLINSAHKEGLEIKVLISVRNYQNYLFSAFCQAVKANFGLRKNEGFLDFCKREINNIRIIPLIDKWAQLVGDENIYLIDYDNDKSDILEIFFGAFNIFLNPEENEVSKNESIPFLSAQLLRQFDVVCKNKKDRVEFIRFISNIEYDLEQEKRIKERIKKEVAFDFYEGDIEILNKRFSWLKI